MSDVIKIKRRLTSAEALSGAPLPGTTTFNAIEAGELFYNEASYSLHYKKIDTFKDIFTKKLLTTNTDQSIEVQLNIRGTLSAGGSFQKLGPPWNTYPEHVQARLPIETRKINPNQQIYNKWPASTTRYVQQLVGLYDGGNFEDYTPPTIAKYWYVDEANESTNWYNLKNWRTSVWNFASVLPTSAANVVLSGIRMPLVDLDNPNWIQPKSINSIATGGIQFTSALSATVTCEITGNAIFLNTATYGTL